MTLHGLQYLMWSLEAKYHSIGFIPESPFVVTSVLFAAEIDGDAMCARIYAEQVGEERRLIETVELA